MIHNILKLIFILTRQLMSSKYLFQFLHLDCNYLALSNLRVLRLMCSDKTIHSICNWCKKCQLSKYARLSALNPRNWICLDVTCFDVYLPQNKCTVVELRNSKNPLWEGLIFPKKKKIRRLSEHRNGDVKNAVPRIHNPSFISKAFVLAMFFNTVVSVETKWNSRLPKFCLTYREPQILKRGTTFTNHLSTAYRSMLRCALTNCATSKGVVAT